MIVLTPQILVVPAAHLPISVERQQQIINTIKAALQRNPMQGFCLTGSPKKGKTYLLKAIRNSIRSGYRTITTVKGIEGCIVPDFVTLSNWLRARKNTEIGQAEGKNRTLPVGFHRPKFTNWRVRMKITLLRCSRPRH